MLELSGYHPCLGFVALRLHSEVDDLSDNKIGSRESGDDLSSDNGESSDGWERLVHSPLTNLKSLLLPNNDLKWPQPAFNSRIAVMAVS